MKKFLPLAAGAAFLCGTTAVVQAAPAILTVRQGSILEQPDVLQTNSHTSAAEARLAGASVLRLTGVSRTTTTGPLQLEKGQALLSSGRGLLGRRSLDTNVGPITLNLRGTALLSALPGQPVKITVLEGSATARMTERRSHFTEIPAGAMLMISESETGMPAPTEVRLSRLQKTSGLLDRPFGILPADPDMKRAIARQERELDKKRLLASNVRVKGNQASIGGADSGSDSNNSGGSSSSSSSSSGGSSSSSSSSASGGASGGGAGGAIHCVGCASHATPVGAVSANDPNRIAQIRAEAAAAGNGASREGAAVPGGKISTAISLPNANARGDLDSAPSAETAITVSNSSDLNALSQAIILAAFGEKITVENSNFTRKPGAINMDAGTIFERTLSLNQSTFAADVIKARSFNAPGTDALVINGGAFNASQILRLYAEGGGALRFSGEVSLSGPATDLAGSVVQIDPGSRVRATGNVRVFSDDHRYDREGFGTLESTTPKTALPFANRPRY